MLAIGAAPVKPKGDIIFWMGTGKGERLAEGDARRDHTDGGRHRELLPLEGRRELPELEEAAWYNPEPREAAENIRDHMAFYGNKVEVAG